MTLKAKCACGTKAYRSQAAAERALAKVTTLGLRSTMPKRVAQCGFGQWHLEGVKHVDTGPDRNTRQTVMERDDWRCAHCGEPVKGTSGVDYSIQHRVARGSGGTSDPRINSPINLILLCGSATTLCHGKAESRDPEMHRKGFWLTQSQRPQLEPVVHAVHGRVYLLDHEPWVMPADETDVQP